jgi:hypothetical protein
MLGQIPIQAPMIKSIDPLNSLGGPISYVYNTTDSFVQITNPFGQQLSANSIPVVLPSDALPLPVSLTQVTNPYGEALTENNTPNLGLDFGSSNLSFALTTTTTGSATFASSSGYWLATCPASGSLIVLSKNTSTNTSTSSIDIRYACSFVAVPSASQSILIGATASGNDFGFGYFASTIFALRYTTSTINTILQSSWNQTSTPYVGYNPTQANIYSIIIENKVSCILNFRVLSPLTGLFVSVHQVSMLSSDLISYPNFQFKLNATSTSGTLTANVYNFMLFVQSRNDCMLESQQYAFSVYQTAATTLSTETPILSLYNNPPQYKNVRLLSVNAAANQTSLNNIIRLDLLQANLSGMTGSSFHAPFSFTTRVTVDTTSTAVTSLATIWSGLFNTANTRTFDLTTQNIIIPCNYVMCLAIFSSVAVTVSLTVNWEELY